MDHLIALIQQYGLGFVFLNVLALQAGLPLPAYPTLMVAGAHDKQVPPDRVRDLFADLGSPQKVFVDLACSSHNAMWERNHLLLFKASLDWLTGSAVNGSKDGSVRLGY